MKWISVKDRLPDDYERVLVCLRDGGFITEKDRIEIATFLEGEFYIHIIYRDGTNNDLFTIPYCVGRVTHWMPLPETPKDLGL